jgi:hypothetical protein
LIAVGAVATSRRADESPMATVSDLARPNGRAAKIVERAIGKSSKHLDLVTHRISESDVERSLCATGLHRLVAEPAKPLPSADRGNTRHHDLDWIGRHDLR